MSGVQPFPFATRGIAYPTKYVRYEHKTEEGVEKMIVPL